tara:strand:+ start:1016 stop:1246 length:231 start_codon:yes stop_codon:yes gene_type:complete
MSRSRDLANLANNATGLETLTVSDITDLTASATELNKLDGATATFVGDITMPTTNKVKQKGAFMQSSTHQALVLGY